MRVYVCPALTDWLFFLVAFAVSYGAGKHGMSVGQLAWISGVCQILYMTTSLATGAFLTRRNALSIVVGSTVTSAVIGVFCVASATFWPLLITMACLGVSMAFFFNSFQSFMRGESAPGELTRTTSYYTLAWSTGCGLGMLTSGALYKLGPVALGGLIVLVGGVILGAMLQHKARPHNEPSAEEHTEHGPEGTAPVAPEYVWIGWFLIFTASFVQRPLTTYYPEMSARMHVAPVLAGLPLFLHYAMQAVGGFNMQWLRRWLYRRGPLMAIQLAAAAGFLVLWRFPSYTVTAIGISVLGLWGAFSYYCAVYYSSNAGHRGRNISVNEFLVGLGSFASVFVAEWFINLTGSDAVMYAVCAGALLVSVAAQWGVLAWKKAE